MDVINAKEKSTFEFFSLILNFFRRIRIRIKNARSKRYSRSQRQVLTPCSLCAFINWKSIPRRTLWSTTNKRHVLSIELFSFIFINGAGSYRIHVLRRWLKNMQDISRAWNTSPGSPLHFVLFQWHRSFITKARQCQYLQSRSTWTMKLYSILAPLRTRFRT